ncbi:MAG: HAMP domain-containing histidine kinase [Clostridia bacterium]|nr:HAMP domain-containing histidine kinase [Clostridia bacterium]
MIKRLRRRFILIAMLSFFAVLTLLVGTINLVNFVQTESNIDGMLHLLSDNRGIFSGEMGEIKDMPVRHGREDRFPGTDVHITPETPYETRYFVVDLTASGETARCDTSHIAAIDEAAAVQYALSVVESGRDRGRMGGIYRYYREDRPDGGCTVVFLDCREQMSSRSELLISSIIIELVSLIAVFLPVYWFSGRAIRPVAESIEKQKRFITDASHEIKTPLAIISANTEVLSMTEGDNEWLDSIKNQTSRLARLVERLVMLSRLDETNPPLTLGDFSLSDAVYDAAYPFGTLAENCGKRLVLDIAAGLTYHGDEGAIRQLVSLLCDNAVKYSDENGEIRVSLTPRGKGSVLEVSNDCRNFDVSELPHLFDRFYRVDDSRSRKSGGYGIGLSVAKAICDAHGAKIIAAYDRYGRVIFTVYF